MTLEEAIQTQINLGEKDPLVIVSKITRSFGDAWLKAEVAAMAEEFAAILVRDRVNAIRNRALAKADESKQAQSEFLISAKWVPDVGYVKVAELTAAHCRNIAKHYMMLSVAAEVRAHYYNTVADWIAEENVTTVAELTKKRDLPSLESWTPGELTP